MSVTRRLRVWSVGALVIGALLQPAAPVWAGAWTLPQNRWYAEYFYRVYHAKKDFNQDGNSNRKSTVGMFRDIRNEWKLEYGLTDWLNLLASVPYQSAHYRDDNTDLLNSNVGDIYVRTKLRLLNKPLLTEISPLVGSIQFSWKIPSAYDPRESPGLGDGQFDFESRLLLSQSWVFSPYEVWTKKPSSASGSSRPHASHAARSVPRDAAIRQAVNTAQRTLRREGGLAAASSESVLRRDAAIQRAVTTAELYEQGAYFARRHVPQAAVECFRAVLEQEPDHLEAKRMLFNELIVLADAAQTGAPSIQLVDDARYELVPQAQSESETRYARAAFVNFEGGFTARNEDPANEFPLVAEAGITPWKRLMLVGRLDNVVSVTSTNEEIENWLKWDVRAVLNVWGDGFASVFREGVGPTVNVEVGYADIAAGRNTGDAYEIYGKLGVFF